MKILYKNTTLSRCEKLYNVYFNCTICIAGWRLFKSYFFFQSKYYSISEQNYKKVLDD